jgi:hypothetical protein
MTTAASSSSPQKSEHMGSSPLRPTAAAAATATTPAKNERAGTPSSAKSADKSAPAAGSQRPSAEDLVNLERDLQRLLARKTRAEATLVTLECRLFDMETEYLAETASFGSLLTGLEGYLGLTTATGNALQKQQRNTIAASSFSSLNSLTSSASTAFAPGQRLFSQTSSTFPESLALAGRLAEAQAQGYNASGGAAGASASGSAAKNPNRTKSNAAAEMITRRLSALGGSRASEPSRKGANGNSNSSSSNNSNNSRPSSPTRKSPSASTGLSSAASPTKKSQKASRKAGTEEPSQEWVPPAMKSSRIPKSK